MAEAAPRDDVEKADRAPGTPGEGRGFAGRVVAAGIWTLAGQAATSLASLICTPFGIRALSAELYGVLALVNLVIGYVGFADLALGAASTKFAAGEYARGSRAGEAAVIWTSLAVVASTASAMAVFVGLATPLLLGRVFSLPPHLWRV